ncbi:hypothetical protein [Bacillus sp. ISL-45]|uniref:hypothetical protein n=1 Tax=Bacillus sp. ISL-45 TaxID=2819128 RepID=UPI001BED1081|nr:hypothetical protein [Bacillus sp. ISL-45]MBT2661570.1 hypothetical protein [Bacillus sp. ISL-45]
MEKEFMEQVNEFRRWASKHTRTAGAGEWETEYHHWEPIYQAAAELVARIPVCDWDHDILDNFLYILARDNECENILELLIQYPAQLTAIARHAVAYEDPDTRWQIAFGLGEINTKSQEIKNLSSQFLLDGNEYVRRRASMAWEKKWSE